MQHQRVRTSCTEQEHRGSTPHTVLSHTAHCNLSLRPHWHVLLEFHWTAVAHALAQSEELLFAFCAITHVACATELLSWAHRRAVPSTSRRGRLLPTLRGWLQ